MNIEIFYKTPKDLEKAVGYISQTTRLPVEFRATDKRVIVYLLDRLNFFVDRLGGIHFESQGTIADALGMNYQAVGDSLRKLTDDGVVVGEKKKPEKGRERWFYYAVNTKTILWVGRKEAPVVLDSYGNPERTARSIEARELDVCNTPADEVEELPSFAR